MRILVVHHGTLPSGTDDRPETGAVHRTAVHVRALRGAGHEVRTLARAQDEPGGFRSPGDLRRLATAIAPDWILCVAPEEAPALGPVAPLVVDLYAPRLLEAAFEGLQEEEAGRALRAIRAADEVIFSNPRQRWFWLGILGMCGWDLANPAGLLVPLAVPTGPPRTPPARPRFLVGGHPWPWQDATQTLARAVEILGDRAEIHSYGLPPLAGVVAHPLVGIAQWRAACAGSTAALDRYAPNAERALAMSFRQMDYIGCGLPLISDPDTPLAEAIRATGAGWVDESLEEALEWALSAPRDPSALAARFHPDRTEAALLTWIPRRRERSWSLYAAGARLAAAEARAQVNATLREAAAAEVAAKRAEIEALNLQVRSLVSSVKAATGAAADSAGFRRETVQVLGTRLAGQTAAEEALRREVEVLRADLAKKNVELEAAHAERDRVGQALAFLRGKRG